jgi:hypothetical protein
MQINSKIRNAIIRICCFFIFLHSDVSCRRGLGLIVVIRQYFLVALTFSNLILSDLQIAKKLKLIEVSILSNGNAANH